MSKVSFKSHTAKPTNPASFANRPTGPTLRANLFSEVTDIICRLPLTYIILLSIRGCSPWRPVVNIGTARHEIQGFVASSRVT